MLRHDAVGRGEHAGTAERGKCGGIRRIDVAEPRQRGVIGSGLAANGEGGSGRLVKGPAVIQEQVFGHIYQRLRIDPASVPIDFSATRRERPRGIAVVDAPYRRSKGIYRVLNRPEVRE